MSGPGLAIGHAIGRIGCLLSGDGDWGTVSNLPWAMAYPKAIVGWTGRTVLVLSSGNSWWRRPDAPRAGCAPWVRVHPAPVYETILYTGVFLVLWAIRKKPRIDGQLFCIYLVMAGALPVPGRVHQGQSAGAVGIVRGAVDCPYDGRYRGRGLYLVQPHRASQFGRESGGLSRHRDEEQKPVGRRGAAGSDRVGIIFPGPQPAIAPGNRTARPARRRLPPATSPPISSWRVSREGR